MAAHILKWRSAQTERDLTAFLGMLIALCGWTMAFASFFLVAGYLRARSSAWPPPGAPALPLVLPTANTVVLLMSSGTAALALRQIRQDDLAGLYRWLCATMALGVVFLAIQALHWNAMATAGLLPSTGAYGAVFYGLTVFHAAHVTFGVGLLAWVLYKATQRTFSNATHVPVRLSAMFWHFIDGAWLVTFVLLYLL